MDQFRRVVASIQRQLGGLGPSQKLLFACLGVILLMTLFLVSQYAGKSNMVELVPGGTAEDHQRAAAFLRTSTFRWTEGAGGRPLVPVDSRQPAYAAMIEAGQQPSNSAIVFENILKTQNWLNSKEQNRQVYKIMLDNWLSGVVTQFSGVKLAKVFVDAPEPNGIGRSVRPPKASVTIFMDAGRSLPQETVDASARAVAGSVAGLDLANVTVVDGTTGKPRTVRIDDDLAPSTYREYATAVERQFRDKLRSFVSHIDGVVVEVTAIVDVSRRRAQVTETLPLNEGSLSVPRKESSTSQVDSQAGRGAEPGVRSNVAASINESGGAPGSRSETRQEDTEYATSFGTRVEHIEDPRGMPTRIVATVAIPRGFVVSLLQRETAAPEGADKKAEPTAAEIDKRFQEEEMRLLRALTPHVRTVDAQGRAIDGEVIVTMISSPAMFAGMPMEGGLVPGLTGGGTVQSLMALGNGALDKIVLAVLAIVALGMMVVMVRRAGRHVAPPPPEELAGAPPALPNPSEVVGEADESETAMAGIIVGESDLKAVKLREQVSELIQKSPDTAVKVLNRWVAVEE
jgi:flagellar M-ring protein FliF